MTAFVNGKQVRPIVADRHTWLTCRTHCRLCGKPMRLEPAPEPILDWEQYALAAITGRDTTWWWVPEGVPLLVCGNGHVRMNPDVDIESFKKATLDIRRLTSQQGMTGADRRRLERARARIRRFCSSQKRWFDRIQAWVDALDLSKIPTVEFTTLNISLPITGN